MQTLIERQEVVIFIGSMGSSSLSRATTRTALGLLIGGASLLPGACGGKTDVVFVGSSGGSDGSGGEGGEGGMGGANTGGSSTGGGGTGGIAGTGGGNTGGSGGGNAGGTGGSISATCGNDETEPGEDCDSGGQDASNCDFDCTGAECGDGHTNEEAREACDDEGESASCDDDCSVPECGDGVLNESAGEQCDDDNNDDGDGCTAECVRELLILGDGASEIEAAAVLRAEGFPVAVAPVLENLFDGTNPALDNFCGVIQFDGTYNQPMTIEGQTALVDFVDAGGGFMSTGWAAVEAENYGNVDILRDELVLIDFDTFDAANVYEVTPEGASHPIVADLPASFPLTSRTESGVCKSGSVALLNEGGKNALCVSDEPERRVVSLGSAFSYSGYAAFPNTQMKILLVNAANWLCGTQYPPRITPGSTAVVSHVGYQAQCQAWEGDLCIAPYLTLNAADVSAPVPHCIDDATSLRPIWFGTATDQAMTWCWIATGSSTYSIASDDGTNSVYSGLWMYTVGAGSEICDDGYGRHYSNVNVPTVGAQVWSFDDTDYIRQGTFMNVACTW